MFKRGLQLFIYLYKAAEKSSEVCVSPLCLSPHTCMCSSPTGEWGGEGGEEGEEGEGGEGGAERAEGQEKEEEEDK